MICSIFLFFSLCFDNFIWNILQIVVPTKLSIIINRFTHLYFYWYEYTLYMYYMQHTKHITRFSFGHSDFWWVSQLKFVESYLYVWQFLQKIKASFPGPNLNMIMIFISILTRVLRILIYLFWDNSYRYMLRAETDFFGIIFDVRLFWIVYSFACWLECIPSASRPILYGYKLERQALSTLKTWELLCTLIHRSGQVPEIDFFTCCKVHILMVLHYLLIE